MTLTFGCPFLPTNETVRLTQDLQKRACAIILARPVSRTAPGGVHGSRWWFACCVDLVSKCPQTWGPALDSTEAKPRVAAFVSPPPRPQPRAAWAGAFPDAPPPWAPLAVPAPVPPPPHHHTERPRCLASAATALLFLLPPHMQILQNVHPSPPFVEGPGGGLPAV